MLKNILRTVWHYTIGAVVYCLPLFVTTVVLLSPTCLNPDSPVSYITGWMNLFMFDPEYAPAYARNDLYYTIGIACAACVLVNMLAKTHLRHTTSALCVVWYALLIISFITRRFLLWTFDTGISAETISMLLETNSTEADGFARSFLLTWQGAKYAIKAGGIVCAIAAAEWLWSKYRHKVLQKHIVKLLVTLLAIAMAPFAIMSAYSYQYIDLLCEQNTISTIVVALDGIEEKSKQSEMFYGVVAKTHCDTHAATCSEDSLDVVFVIGESFIKHHAQVYGYYLPTTPCMQSELERGNIVMLRDMMTPFRYTTPAMKNMLSLNNLSKSEEWNNSAFWPQLFHIAGYRTAVFDNQRGTDRHYSGSFYELYSTKVAPLCFNYTSDDLWHYDQEMPATVAERLKDMGKKTFTILHLYGQHFHFADKSPDEDKVFTAADIKRKEPWLNEEKRQLIADYDNAVRQTDKTLGQLYDIFRNRRAVIVFLSDHGEEVYDYRDKTNRPPMDKNMKAQYLHCIHDVPCVIWMSDSYKACYQEVAKSLILAKDRPYSHDLIGQMMLTLGRVNTPYYRPDEDILNSQYRPYHRFLAEDNALDYDSLMNTSVYHNKNK
ncbi:MAG: phosphoethanolamine transferase [Prevotella sp.]|nr:phosphoethanolamine transferase [Prevotella sp.]